MYKSKYDFKTIEETVEFRRKHIVSIYIMSVDAAGFLTMLFNPG